MDLDGNVIAQTMRQVGFCKKLPDYLKMKLGLVTSAAEGWFLNCSMLQEVL